MVVGPGIAFHSITLSRLSFHEDIKYTSTTDGFQSQGGHACDVGHRMQFHEMSPKNNFYKIPGNLCGICLRSQIFGRALELCKGMSDDKIALEQNTNFFLTTSYKRDALAVGYDIHMSRPHISTECSKRHTCDSSKQCILVLCAYFKGVRSREDCDTV